MLKLKFLLAIVAACCLLPRLTRAQDSFFDSNGVKIRYVTAGEGEAVVLIHGWMGDSSMWGRDKAGNTKLDVSSLDGFQLIALDCRGHGKSDKPHDPAQYGAEMAADLVRLLDHLKIEKAHLIGYSMGAFIAGKVAGTHPERVLSIVYGGQAPLIAGSPASGSNEVEVLAKAVEEGTDLGAYIIAVTPPDKPKPTMEWANMMAKFMFSGKDLEALVAAGRSFNKLEVTPEELRKCQAPTLFIYGGNESEYVKGSVAYAREALGRGEVKVVEGGDHITTLLRPEFGSTIRDFLRTHRAGTLVGLGE
jgi:pimeloyl-ACP methyl ester carboxylesterase